MDRILSEVKLLDLLQSLMPSEEQQKQNERYQQMAAVLNRVIQAVREGEVHDMAQTVVLTPAGAKIPDVIAEKEKEQETETGTVPETAAQ